MKPELTVVIIPACILIGMVIGMLMIRDDVADGSKISVRGTVYKCERVKSGY